MLRCGKFLRCEDCRTIDISGCSQQIQDRIKIGPDSFHQLINLALRHGQRLNIASVNFTDGGIRYGVTCGDSRAASISIQLRDKGIKIGYKIIEDIKYPLLIITIFLYLFCVSHF